MIRNHNGYKQIRNCYEKPDGKGGFKKYYQWEYIINGFNDDNSECAVALATGGYTTHPIDAKNRLTVRGPNGYTKTTKWYH
jgi:hypothetical protein